MELCEVIDAYFDCRRHKRYTANALCFEKEWEKNCVDLCCEINERRYNPRRSICFVVNKPVKREIFAADFRDRVVHHLIARRIYPLLEKQFLIDSYSTQKGKGTLFGIERIEQHLRECSADYTRDCWIMKLDIEGFFMSINKQRLYDCILEFLVRRYKGDDLPELLYMLRKTIFNRPELNCIRKMSPIHWKGLPSRKSLFGTDGTAGLPIGNLTSQLLALLYLDGLDHLMAEEWHIGHYGRYVDDMVMIHPSMERLLEVRLAVDAYLKARGLNLHPRKTYLQYYRKGVPFVGAVIKPGRKYVSNRTVARLNRKLYHFSQELARGQVCLERLNHIQASVNSYLGMMNHYASERLFHRVLRWMGPEWYRYFVVHKCGRKVKLIMRRRESRGQVA